MPFDPVGPFRAVLTAPLPAAVVAAARAFATTFPTLNPGDRGNGRDPAISRIYDHWSVQAQGCVDAAYNAVVTKRDGIFVIEHSTDVRLNARTYDQHGEINDLPAGYAQHTYHRNTGARSESRSTEWMEAASARTASAAIPSRPKGLLYLWRRDGRRRPLVRYRYIRPLARR